MTSLLRFDFNVSPWVLDLLTHLWQSTAVALVILLLVGFTKGLSARTRRTLGWIAVVKFFLPAAWLVKWMSPAGGASESWLTSRSLVVPMNLAPAMHAGATPHGSISAVQLMIALWAVVAIGLLAWWTTRAAKARRRIFKSSTPALEELAQQVANAATRVGLSAAPRCVMVAAENGPGLVGVFEPVLILPGGLVETLKPAELDSILIHECVHLQQRDNLWSAMRAVFVALFWFNPIAWLLNRSIGIEAEKACDERVIEVTGDADSYARGIVAAVRHSLGIVGTGFSGATTPPVLGRVQAILAFPARRERPLVRRLVLVAGVALVGLSGRAGSIAAEASKAAETTSAAPQPARYKVGTVTIKFSGTPNVDEQVVRDAMQIKPGGDFDEVILDRDIRSIYRTGWFETIEVKHTPVNATTFNLVVEVTPKPANRVGDPAPQVPAPSAPSASAVSEAAATVQMSEAELNDAKRKLQEARERLQKLRDKQAELAQAKERDRALASPAPSPSVAPTHVAPTSSTNASPAASALASETQTTEPVYDISALDRAPGPRFQARPKYPFEMRRAGIGGEVVVDFVVNNKGDVVNAYAIRSSRVEFEAAAVEAVSKWRFRPGMKGGQDVNTHMQIPIIFTLNEQ